MGHRYKTSPSGSSNVIDYDGARASRERQAAIDAKREEKLRRKREAAALVTDTNRAKSDQFYRSIEWMRLRYRALRRDRGRCQYCGRSAKDGVVLHVDHIKPKSRFPKLALVLSNLQVLCASCNYGKGAHDQTDWR